MKVSILCVGKKHDALYAPAIAEFEKRLTKQCSLEWRYIPASDKTTESVQMSSRLSEDSHVLLLDETGTEQSTTELARKIEQLQNQSTKRLVIVIGGAYGVTQDLRDRAHQVIALSKLTFPHQLVRLITIEQLYRAYDILAGGKYHHD